MSIAIRFIIGLMASLSWIDLAQRLHAIGQTGLTYAKDPYDRERYDELIRLASSMMTGPEPETVRLACDLLKLERGYATPKVDVRAAIFQKQKILLVREREDDRWTLPGGWADVGLSPAECVEKEVREEAGLIVKARKLLAAWDRNKHPHPPLPFHVYKMVFHCEAIGGSPTAQDETTGVDFFGEDEIPPLSLTRILPAQIQQIFDHVRHPERPPAFD
jgi:ADP-ribose pyrophosphatase YjhB (NUDIX family)